ncbi:MAG: hypothetical protein R3Y29_02315 [bacterium]
MEDKNKQHGHGHGHHHKGNPKDSIKNRLPIGEMKEPIEEFCRSQKELYISLQNNTEFPDLEVVDYRYIAEGKHVIILTPLSIFLNKLEDGSKFSGFIFDKKGRGLKMTKRVYGKFVCKGLTTDDDILLKLAETDELLKKMLTHGAKFFELEAKDLNVFFSDFEIFNMDSQMNPTFAEYTPSGKKRYENSRHIVMEYEDREVIFNTLIEGNTYRTLTRADSNKVAYIKNDGEFKFYDGRDRHFLSKITILEDKCIEDIAEKLRATNHMFFKSTDNLLALEFYFK